MGSKFPRKVAVAGSEGGHGLTDLAYKRVLELLFDRRLLAGSFVSQAELVQMTGVQIAPLRFALKILEAEGILTIRPRTGIQFIRPGMELTRSTFQFRSMIETKAVRVYAETGSDADMRDLRVRHQKVTADIEAAGLTPDNLPLLEELEELLHGSIVSSLNNILIDTSYRRIRNYLKLIRLDRRLTSPLAIRSLREHMAIIEACERRDPEGAAAALKTHFNSALQRSLGLY